MRPRTAVEKDGRQKQYDTKGYESNVAALNVFFHGKIHKRRKHYVEDTGYRFDGVQRIDRDKRQQGQNVKIRGRIIPDLSTQRLNDPLVLDRVEPMHEL